MNDAPDGTRSPAPLPNGPRRWPVALQQPLPPATVVDRCFFLLGTASAIWLAVIIAGQGFSRVWAPVLFLPVWAIMAYLALPRLHRLLSDLYVPSYFFGRTRTADGLLGDPVNLGVDGSAEQLDAAMTAAGWHRADEISALSALRIVGSTLTRRSYPTAPVSPLMLFGRRHDVAYQQEVAGNPKQRHHVRFWHCPPGWLLPGGEQVDWLGAATYDTDVGLSFFTLQITHRIDENTDVERDHVVATVTGDGSRIAVRTLHDFTTGYHARNGGGDRFITDGDLPILDLSGVTGRWTEEEQAATPAAAPGEPDQVSRLRRVPLSTVAAVVLTVAVGLVEVASAAVEIFTDPELATIEGGRVAGGFVVGFITILVITQMVVAVFVARGGRRARVLLLILLLLGIVAMAVDYLDGTVRVGLDATLLGATLHCLALLALSSESAGAYARTSRTKIA